MLSIMHKSGLLAGLCVETVVGCRSERHRLSKDIPSVYALSIWYELDERGAVPGMCTSLPLSRSVLGPPCRPATRESVISPHG